MNFFEHLIRISFRGTFALGGVNLFSISGLLLQSNATDLYGSIARVILTLAFWIFGVATTATSCFPSRRRALIMCSVLSILLGLASPNWISNYLVPYAAMIFIINGVLLFCIRLCVEFSSRMMDIRNRFQTIVWGTRKHWI